MPNAGFVGVRHREYTKVCDSAFLFRASSRCAGRCSNSKDDTVNGFMCMSNTRVAGVGHSRKAELIKQRYFHSMPYAGFAGVEHTKGMALNWVECWLVLVALLTLLCPTPAKPAWGIGERRRTINKFRFTRILNARYAGVGHKRERGTHQKSAVFYTNVLRPLCGRRT